jgi:hypothetical protein
LYSLIIGLWPVSFLCGFLFHSNFFTIRVGLHGFSHVREIQRRIPAYFGHQGSLH